MRANQDHMLTQYYLQFCYTCQDAYGSTTEEDCKQCAERYAEAEDCEVLDETQHYLQLVHV
jgi:hypothetical protein